jgi:hypothetical protein
VTLVTVPAGAQVWTSWTPGGPTSDRPFGVTPVSLCVAQHSERYRIELAGYEPVRVEPVPRDDGQRRVYTLKPKE